MQKTIACITVGLSLILLAGCGQQQTSTAHAAEPCEFEEGSSFCVNLEGDVYFDIIGHQEKTCEASGPKHPSCDVVPAGMCLDGVDWGICPDEDGKIGPNDGLPVDVCGDGTYQAPCYPQDKSEEHRQYREPFRAG